MASTPEGKVKEKGRQICRDLGIYYFAVNQTGLSTCGIPDDCLCVAGMFVHIEYKAHMRWDKNHKTAHATLPRLNQIKAMEDCRKSGGITLVVDDTNIDLLKDVLIRIIELSDANPPKVIAPYALDRLPCGWDWTVESFLRYKQSGVLLNGPVDCSRP